LRSRAPNGQAAVEMVVVLPLILLLAAGLFQTGLLLIHANRFDQACGFAARRYAAGDLEENQLADAVWSALGSSQAYFENGSIHLETPDSKGESSSSANQCSQGMEDSGELKKVLKSNPVFNYSKGDWRITATFRSKPLFGLLFPKGIQLGTEVCVYRYKGGVL
jgi:hypothetical protein